MSKMRYLGIDFGATTGVAELHEDGEWAETYRWTLAGGPQMEGHRYREFAALVEKLLSGRCRVVFEEPSFHRGGAAGKQNAGYRALLMAACERAVVPYASVPVGTLKKFASEVTSIPAGKGKLREQAIQHGAREPVTHDEADAYWLAVYGRDALEW